MPPVQEPRTESRFDPWEVVDLLGGFAVVALPLFLLAIPAVVLLLPLAIVGLAIALVVAPPLAVAWAIWALLRRSRDRRAAGRLAPANVNGGWVGRGTMTPQRRTPAARPDPLRR